MNFTVDHNWIFKKATNSIVIIILYILLLALLIGAVRLVLSIPQLMNNDGLDVTFYQIVANSLTLFIVIEFFKTLHDYSKYERIKLTFIIDATILIVLREISVGLFTRELSYMMILALSTLLIVMGIIRVLAVRYSPKDV
ncbi:MAG: phosphate-starvation-inducible PsiE family protein [Methanosarcinales archaeon]|nr:phosphate-starvation-inducible PsiE family protein [ANME-2 cluster archaeon]MDW7776758.1 phosphate-starvation-inducible PsiE family protein [Methanosarcinales archaeon]